MEEGLGPGAVAAVWKLSQEEEEGELGPQSLEVGGGGGPLFFSWYLGACSEGVKEFGPSIHQLLHFLWEA